MNEYLLLMHGDAPDTEHAESGELWERYITTLRTSGSFDGGSSIGAGALYRKGLAPVTAGGGLTGFLRVRAHSLEEAACLLAGNPAFEAGGTVEVRVLLPD